MGRPRQPESVSKLKGADKKNPQRFRGEEIVNDMPIGDAPKSMRRKAARDAWDRIVFESLPGVLTASDRISVELAANLLADFWKSPSKMPIRAINTLIGLLAKFGMTPSDRTKFRLPESKKPTGPKILGGSRAIN